MSITDAELCFCPKCGRAHKNLGFGMPPDSPLREVEELRAALKLLLDDMNISHDVPRSTPSAATIKRVRAALGDK